MSGAKRIIRSKGKVFFGGEEKTKETRRNTAGPASCVTCRELRYISLPKADTHHAMPEAARLGRPRELKFALSLDSISSFFMPLLVLCMGMLPFHHGSVVSFVQAFTGIVVYGSGRQNLSLCICCSGMETSDGSSSFVVIHYIIDYRDSFLVNDEPHALSM